MSAPKHTPGPWAILETGCAHPTITNGIGVNVCTVSGTDMGYMLPAEEERANARLIAAAPELLAMLYELAPEDCNGDESCRHCRAHALLARAEGGRE